ncbi:MAG: diguanylate cyclase [Rhodobacteraceae bacterium]|nr:MAG: diguanylate cyclase [Paracoccaceae bacterium]
MNAVAVRPPWRVCAAWPVGVIRADGRGSITSLNAAAADLLGHFPTPPERARDLFALLSAAPGLRAAAARQRVGATPLRRRLRAPDGAHVGVALVREADRSLTALLTDETAQAEAEAEAHRQRARFAALADAAEPDRLAVFVVDAHGRVCAWSRSAEAFEGLPASEAIGLSLDALFDRSAFRADAGLLLEQAARGGAAAVSGRRFVWNATPVRVRLTLRATRASDGEIDGFVAEMRREDAETPREAELRRLADSDPLTGVLNRRAFFACAEEALDALRERGARLSVIVLDLDRFKALNDRAGHAAGDIALRALMDAAREAVRGGDLLGRIGGDEFAIALPRAGLDAAARIAERLRGRIARLGIDTAAGPLRFTASLGVAEAEPGERFVKALERADAALFRAKAAGRNLVARA